MRFAYADPPYLGCAAKFYGDHPDAAAWDRLDTHGDLIVQLVADYPDGWALSAPSTNLRALLPMCPPTVRVGAWVKPFHVFKKGVRPAYAWEAVIFCGGRNANPPAPDRGGRAITPRDWVAANITLSTGLVGAKPPEFCRWVFALLNVQPGDQVDDLFPGTGVLGRELDTWLLEAAS